MENQEKNHIKNLNSQQAIDKLKELVESAGVCMFETILPNPPYNLRPMSPIHNDEQGSLWFFSNKKSDKNKEIQANPNVQLSFSNMKANEYLSIYGTAEIIIDQNKFNELWKPIAKIWFPEGKDAPNLSLIKVTPQNSYYWDTKHNKMVALAKMAAAFVTGKTMDDGVEGDLKV